MLRMLTIRIVSDFSHFIKSKELFRKKKSAIYFRKYSRSFFNKVHVLDMQNLILKIRYAKKISPRRLGS